MDAPQWIAGGGPVEGFQAEGVFAQTTIGTLAGVFDELPDGVARWIPVVVVSVAAVPLALIAVRALARRRAARGVPVGQARRNAAAEVGLIAGTLPWLWMILTPIPAAREVEPIPLVDLADQLQGAPVTAFFQVAGNLLVLSAFGFFAPLRWRISIATVVAIAAAGSLTVEILQYWLALGRVSSADDVLLNAIGAGLAALASRRWWASARPTSPTATRNEPAPGLHQLPARGPARQASGSLDERAGR